MSVERLRTGRVALRDVAIRLGHGQQAFDAISSVSFDAEPGQFVCILGPSGCGKSTLLGALAGFLDVTCGSLSMDGVAIRGPSVERCMVFQQHTLLPWRNALDNVAFGLKMRGMASAERRQRAGELLRDVGLAGFEHHYPAQLSGGMQQRVELARALVQRPNLLLMDEPFGALDAQTRLDMQELLLEVWTSARPTIVFVTHDVDEALFLGDRVLVMSSRPGRIKADIEVSLPRPRSIDSLTSSSFVQLRRRCIELVREETKGGRALTRTPPPALRSITG
jgi:NitT/TauT family transport system ATP-binding protein